MFALCLLTFFGTCLMLYIILYVYHTCFRVHRCTFSRVLFITAHPDDECMFFGPTINHFLGHQAKCRLLCLSSGNYYNMGEVRKKELINSCNILGLEKSAITVIEDNNLADDPNIEWNTSLIAEYVKKQVHAYSIDKIVTFDAYGVSGHSNHASVFQAIRLLNNSDEISKEIEILVLESKSCLTKYLSVFSLPFVLLNHLVTNSQLYISSPLEVLHTQRAMLKHWSQMMWFRVFYICLSQYMIINSVHVFKK